MCTHAKLNSTIIGWENKGLYENIWEKSLN